MKILFCTTLDLQIKTFHWRTIDALSAMGHTVDAVTNGPYTIDSIHRKYTVPFHRNPLHPDNLKAERQLIQMMEENRYDIISCHSPTAGFYGRKAASRFDAKIIYTAHGFHFWKGSPVINQVAYKNMERLAAHWTDVLVTINPEDYEAAKTFTYRNNGGPVYIPGVGVDVRGIQAQKEEKSVIRKELGIDEDAFVLYSIGELIPRKNHRFVIDTLKKEFRIDPKLHYVIAGNGQLTEELGDYLKKTGLEKQVHLLGFRKDARKLLYGMDVFVFPSLQEGLPVAVMEAMAAGLPVIASDICGSHDLIRSGENGYLFPVNDAELFRRQLKDLRSSEEKRAAFSEQELKDIEPYSIEVVEPQILALYSDKTTGGQA
ncbi:MAG: glycosyltransferase family 4 protein [Solobacterium sp.]|nr:glycosyltransferase family 4 protein [Solobacterium sp.]